MHHSSNLVNRLLGNYRLIQRLGRGGFAEVYLGEHIHLKTLVAVKVLLTQLTQETVKRSVARHRRLLACVIPLLCRYQISASKTIPRTWSWIMLLMVPCASVNRKESSSLL